MESYFDYIEIENKRMAELASIGAFADEALSTSAALRRGYPTDITGLSSASNALPKAPGKSAGWIDVRRPLDSGNDPQAASSSNRRSGPWHAASQVRSTTKVRDVAKKLAGQGQAPDKESQSLQSRSTWCKVP